MATDDDRKFAAQATEIQSGRTEPALGPSDSSDSGNDMPADAPDTDSDRSNTGERADVENKVDISSADDVDVDKIVPEDKAGLAHTPPDPVRNGG